jgi:hypothetical protein
MKRSARVFVLVMLFGGFALSGDAAQLLKADFALIRYDGHAFQPQWIEGGAFSDVLQRDCQERQRVFLTGPKNVFVSDDLKHRGRKKGKLTFSPRIFIRPVMIIEELQAVFITYQPQIAAFIDGNAQAKTMLPFGDMAQVQQVVISPRIYSFVPYYHKVYGVYLHIIL